MLRQRIITALILAAAFFGAMFGLSERHFATVMLVGMMAAAYEWGRLCGWRRTGSIVLSVIVLVTGLLLVHFAGFDWTKGFASAPLLLICGGAGIFWIAFAPLWMRQGWTTQRPLPMGVLGVFLLLAMWIGMVQLHVRSPWLLLGAMLIVWLADTAAYFTGRKFGKRKLAPLISPNKSWEGVYGALVSVTLYAVLVVLLSPLASKPAPMRIAMVVAAALLAAISVVGDLFESWMKRQAGVKDSGQTLPGHGGILDRIDALIPVLPLATLATLAVEWMS